MAKDNDCTDATFLALFKAGRHQCRPDTFALMLRSDSHRCQAHNPESGIAGERDRRKHDVADDRVVVLSDQRHKRLCLFSQNIDKMSLCGCFKG